MHLSDDERAMLAGAAGEPARRSLAMQIATGDFFGAERMGAITSAHLTGDVESMGDAGLAYVEQLAAGGGRFVVPATTNPRNVDFARYRDFGQEAALAQKEWRLRELAAGMGAVTIDSCINYQCAVPPRIGERLGWGDTGTVIFANAVAGARANFEGGPASYAAALTGRVPLYGMQLDEHRLATHIVEVHDQPRCPSDWGALGCLVGRRLTNYWLVPAFTSVESEPSIDDLKQLGATLASFGSLAMFHLVGVTPEARDLAEALGGREARGRICVEPGDLAATYRSFIPEKEAVDLVVFGTPQLSLFELHRLAGLLDGRHVHPRTTLLLTTTYQYRAEAERQGWAARIEAAGGTVLAGVCYYIMTARRIAEQRGFRTILTDSAKLANIIAASGYNPIFRPTEECVEAAVRGRVER